MLVNVKFYKIFLIGLFLLFSFNLSANEKTKIISQLKSLKSLEFTFNHAIASASRKNPGRMWVHTCSLDHKHALQNYKSKGFEIFKEEEIDFVA